MSTRGMIGRQNADGTITAIYSHCNNYTEANGWLLSTHYTDPAKVDALIALECVSEVGLDIGEQHDYRSDDRVTPGGWRKWCLSFYRDRNETDIMSEIVTRESWPAIATQMDSEMVFLWTGTHWQCAAVHGYHEHSRFGAWYRLVPTPVSGAVDTILIR